ncbi:MAG TPA: FapA family protein [Phycisphaeraceae bacterium]
MSSKPSPSAFRDPQFSSRITRQVVDKAEQLLGPALDEQQLSAILAEVAQSVQDLDEPERQQLREIAQLIEKAHGVDDLKNPLSCAGAFEFAPSPDGMFLSLTIHPPVAGGSAVTVEDVLAWLKERNISRGVDLKTIKRAVEQAQQGKEVRDTVVVRGRPATPGRDARLERFARRTPDGPLEPVRLIGRDDPLLLCRQGDIVMRYIPPVPGEAGYTALGEPIEPPAPQDLEHTAGPHVRVHNNEYIADVSGVVIFEGNRVEARKVLVIYQDLTRKSDPVDFDGEVHVRGAVRSGAIVKASGNIVIEGPVEAAEIHSAQGDVVLRSGVAGQNAAVIRAGRDVIARFAEAASLFAGRDIALHVGSLHSRLLAYNQIEATQGKGQIVGGTVIAGEKIRVKQLGARGGMRTDVTVGLSPDTLNRLGEIEQATARAAQRRNQCTELIEQMNRAVGDPLKLSPKELDVYTRLRQLQLVCDYQIRRLNQQRLDVLAESARHHKGRVEVLLNVMSNVRITIGDAELEPEGYFGPCTYYYHEQHGRITTKRGT